MPLSSGDQLGHYKILSMIGKGGMGEVYKGRDTKLDRDVAIKVLPAAFASDPDRLARFEREAKVLASLNHPGIASIYGVEDRALVMELVPGPTLADRIKQGPIPVGETLEILHQIAEAFEYAHDRGVVHRDLKPANIKIDPEDKVKILDFGLAKAFADPMAGVSDDPNNSPTVTMGGTVAGTILGTAAYMAPEQARGKKVDKRADIWAFGVVLWEMLTGERLFPGDTTVEVLGKVLEQPVDLERVSQKFRKLLGRCLDRNAKDRLRDIGEARFLLESSEEHKGGTEVPLQAKTRSTRMGRLLWPVVAGALTVVGGAVSFLHFRETRPEAPVVRVATSMAVQHLFGALAISPDGSRIAFASGASPGLINVRAMDQLEAKPIAGTEGAAFLSFSPGGNEICFVDLRSSPNLLKKVAVTGGVVQTLTPLSAAPFSRLPHPSWGSDGNILFIDGGALTRIPSTGGKPVVIAKPEIEKTEVSYASGQLLPGDREILVGVNGGPTGHPIMALNPQTGAKKRLLTVQGAAIAQFVPAGASANLGYLVYYTASTGSLMAVPFDTERLELKGDPVPVIDGVMTDSGGGPYAFFAISNSGTLVYIPGVVSPSAPAYTLVWVDRKGGEDALAAPMRSYVSARVSPTDGNRIAASIISNGSSDIWVYDATRGTLDRISTEGSSQGPVWTPDGKRIVYERNPGSGHPAVMWAPADRSAPPSALATRDKAPIAPNSVSSDGKLVLGYYPLEKGLWTLPVEGPTGGGSSKGVGPRSILESEFRKSHPDISPDGHWVAYGADDTGRPEIYVSSYPDSGPKVTISTDGGTLPRWSRNGRELFYRSGAKMMAVDVQTSPTFRAGRAKLMFEGNYRSYDVSADGQRFLMVKVPAQSQAATSDQVTIVFNWFEELRRRVPLGK